MADISLRPIKEPAALPFAVTFPLQTAALDERLYLAWAEADGGAAWLAAVDRDGSLALSPVRLPLGYVESLAACAGKLYLVATLPGGADPHLVALDAQGELAWETALQVEETLVRWPRLVCSAARLHLYWELGGANPAVCVTALHESRLEACLRVNVAAEKGGVGSVPLEPGAAASDALEAAPFAAGLILARVPASLAGIEMIRIAEQHSTFPQDIPDRTWIATSYPSGLALGAASTAGGGDRLALAWISNPSRSLLAQQFAGLSGSAGLAPLGPIQPEAQLKAPANIRSARFITGAAGRLALSLQVLVDHDPRPASAGSFASTGLRPGERPARTASQFIGLYSLERRQTGPFIPVTPAGSSFDTGGWIGGRLLLVHGERQPVVSVFQVSN